MKAVTSSLVALAALVAAAVASGCDIDAVAAFAFLFATALAGGFVADYHRPSRTLPARPARIPVRPAVPRPRAGVVFESAIIFHTRVA